MSSNRINRINEEIQKELSALLRTVKDPRVQDTMISITRVETTPDLRYTKVYVSFLQEERVKDAMNAVGVTGMTVTNVMGCGTQKGHVRKYRGVEIEELNLNPKMKLEMVISAVPVETVIAAAREALYTGNIGDGKIFVYDVEDAVKVRTGARGYDALQGTDD